jgi:hypothetical protein
MKMMWLMLCKLPEPVKLAPTVVDAVTIKLHEAVPEHAPDQPVNEFPGAGAAVRFTVVPLLKAAEHVGPQLIPAGELVTVPDPLTLTVTCKPVEGGGGPGWREEPELPPPQLVIRNAEAAQRAQQSAARVFMAGFDETGLRTGFPP